jgi:hypothetical protein
MLKKTWELLDYLPMPRLEDQFAERTISHIRLVEASTTSWHPRFQTWVGYVNLAIVYLAIAGSFAGVGYTCTRWIWPDDGARLASEISLAEHLDAYLDVGSFDFLKQLVDSGQFSGEAD